jgi:hypothetical protein
MAVKPSAFPVFVALKMSSELAQAVKRAAREDDRTVSGYLRRLIAAAVQPERETESQQPDA